MAFASVQQTFYHQRAFCSLLQLSPGDRKQVGGTETGLDCLLRCLEVLSTSEISSIGPYSPDGFQSTAAQSATLEGEQASPMKAFVGEGASDPTAAPANADALGPNNRGAVASVYHTVQHKTTEVISSVGPATPGGGTGSLDNNDTAGQTAAMIPAKDGKLSEEEILGDHEGCNSVSGDTNTPAAVDVMGKGVERRGGVRGNVIRGLARILEPWEYVRQTQTTALLVLGNVLQNVLEAEAGGLDAEQASALVQESVFELEKGVAISGSGDDPLDDEDGADGQRDGDDER